MKQSVDIHYIRPLVESLAYKWLSEEYNIWEVTSLSENPLPIVRVRVNTLNEYTVVVISDVFEGREGLESRTHNLMEMLRGEFGEQVAERVGTIHTLTYEEAGLCYPSLLKAPPETIGT